MNQQDNRKTQDKTTTHVSTRITLSYGLPVQILNHTANAQARIPQKRIALCTAEVTGHLPDTAIKMSKTNTAPKTATASHKTRTPGDIYNVVYEDGTYGDDERYYFLIQNLRGYGTRHSRCHFRLVQSVKSGKYRLRKVYTDPEIEEPKESTNNVRIGTII